MIITAVYTGAPSSLIAKVELELKKEVPEAEIRTMTDPTIIREIGAQGGVRPAQARRLIKMYVDAVCAGADIVYNICSSIGDVADAAEPVIEQMGARLIRIDRDMARYAVAHGHRIGVLATLSTTLEPTKRLLRACAEEIGADIVLVDALADAFGKSQSEMEALLVQQAEKIRDQVDILVLAQASMALCEEKIAAACGLPVVSSPRMGAAAVRRAVQSL